MSEQRNSGDSRFAGGSSAKALARRNRQAQALRENLARRKAQARRRARDGAAKDETTRD